LENRITRCVSQYKNYKKEDLKNAVKKIEKRLGGLATKQALSFIDDEKYEEACHILFFYYDKGYDCGISKRDPKSISYLEISNKTYEQICSFLQDK
jgi:tRNA 2-selenouridine synthase